MLNDFRTHLVARRRAVATIKLRMVHMRQLEAHCNPLTATVSDLEAVLIQHPDWRPETINSAISSWSVFYKWAIRTGLTDKNPAVDLERAHVVKRVKVLADDARIVAALESANPRERAILLLGREAGLRRAEIASLHRNDRVGEWLEIIGKGQRFRRIHITPSLAAALDALPGDGYYFPGHGSPHIGTDTVYRTVKRLIGTAPHSLRRRALTSVYRNSGGDIRMAQEFAGHANPNTTAVYIEVNEDDLIRAGGYAALAA